MTARDTTEADQPALLGSLDGLDDDACVFGWAFDPRHGERRVAVAIYDGETQIGSATAELYRPDLKQAGLGDGHCAFRFVLPGRLFDGKVHSIGIRFADTEKPLPNSPLLRQLDPKIERLPEYGRFELLRGRRIRGWACDPSRRNEPVTIKVLENGRRLMEVLAEQGRPDLAAAGIGDGRHGFDVELPMLAADGLPRNIEVVCCGTYLVGGPKRLIPHQLPTRFRVGEVELDHGRMLRGWVAPAQSGMQPSIDVFDGEHFVTRIVADAASGAVMDSLRAPFCTPVPARFCDGEHHAIHLRRSNHNEELDGSPIAFRADDSGWVQAAAAIQRFDSVYLFRAGGSALSAAAQVLWSQIATAVPVVLVEPGGHGQRALPWAIGVDPGNGANPFAAAASVAAHKAAHGHKRSLFVLESPEHLIAFCMAPAATRVCWFRQEVPAELARAASVVSDVCVARGQDMANMRHGIARVVDGNVPATLWQHTDARSAQASRTIVYPGPLGMDVDYAIILSAIEQLPSDYRFLFVGEIRNNLDGHFLELLDQLSTNRRVRFIPGVWQGHEDRLPGAADAAFFPLLRVAPGELEAYEDSVAAFVGHGVPVVSSVAPASAWLKQCVTHGTSRPQFVAALANALDTGSAPASAMEPALRSRIVRWWRDLDITPVNERREALRELGPLLASMGETNFWRMAAGDR